MNLKYISRDFVRFWLEWNISFYGITKWSDVEGSLRGSEECLVYYENAKTFWFAECAECNCLDKICCLANFLRTKIQGTFLPIG